MTVRLTLERVVSRTFDSASGYPRSTGDYGPELVDFLCDLTRVHGLPQREEYFGRAKKTTFTEMAQAIAADLTEGPDRPEPFGLAVVAHSAPDAEPGWPASYLSGALPGEPLAFAVADQGAAAPFTALRIAADYSGTEQAGGGDRRAALVLIMDQTAIVPDRRLPRGTVPPGRDHAVALVFGPAGRLAALSVRQLTDVTPADAMAAVEAELRIGPGPAIAVLGPGLADREAFPRTPFVAVVRAPADLPGTGPWQELARLLRRPDAADRRILIASYEQTLGYLDLCMVCAGPEERPPCSVRAPVPQMAAQRSMTGVRVA